MEIIKKSDSDSDIEYELEYETDSSVENSDIEYEKIKPLNTPFEITDNMFSHYLCTMVNPSNDRPPIIPSSCTTSIHSEEIPSFLPPPPPQSLPPPLSIKLDIPQERETDL